MVQSHCIECKWRGKLYSISSTLYCSHTDIWVQHTQPEPPLWLYVPSSLRSVLFLVLTRILCSKDFNFFCLLQATVGGMSRAFFSSDEVCSHSRGKGDGGRGSGRQEQAEEWDIQRYELWQEHLDVGTESRFKLDMLFESCEATGLQSAESLLWLVPQVQLRNLLSNICRLACSYG